MGAGRDTCGGPLSSSRRLHRSVYRPAQGCRRLGLVAFLVASCGGVGEKPPPGGPLDTGAPPVDARAQAKLSDAKPSDVGLSVDVPPVAHAAGSDGSRTAIDLTANRLHAVSH